MTNTLEKIQSGALTRTEGVDVLVKLEPHYRPVVVDDVGLAVPGARHHLLSAVTLQGNKTCVPLYES